MTVRELQRRLDRLDGGDARVLRKVQSMTDEQLRRAIAQHLPDPEAFLALSTAQQDEFLVHLTRTQEATP